MVSTYLSYDLINRDMKTSLKRVAQQAPVERQTQYYKGNIGKVKTADEFLANHRLYSYAMDAFGLSEMTYAKAFMKKVLTSDLNDANSFANKLTDTRYRDFAAAFNFSTATATVQTQAQQDELIGLYGTTIDDLDNRLSEETRYYKIVIDQIDNVDKLLGNDRLRAYVFQVFKVDEGSYSYNHIRGLLTSDVADPNSYLNQTYGGPAYEDAVTKLATKGNINLHAQVTARIAEIDTALAGTTLTAEKRAELEDQKVKRQADLTQLESVLPPQAEWADRLRAIGAEEDKLKSIVGQYQRFAEIAGAFEFKADGTVTPGQAQTAEKVTAITQAYVAGSPRVTPTVATLNKDYFEAKIASVKTVKDLMADPRLVSYVKTAFNLNDITIVDATIENILTSDMGDPKNYIATFGNNDKRYLTLREAFNFRPDGTLPDGVAAQTAEQTAKTNAGYMTHYNDKAEEADARALKLFKSSLKGVTTAKDFVGNSAVFNYVLQAIGLDPAKADAYTIRKVLQSDLQDRKSFVYGLNDERYVKLANLFNFKSDGSLGTPLLAQSELDMKNMAADYIKKKSVFGTEADKTKAKDEAKYYTGEIQKIKSLQDLLANPRLTKFAMESLGIDPKTMTPEQLKAIFKSDLGDPQSAVNKQTDPAFRRLVTAFNFDKDGKMLREDRSSIQTRRGLYATLDNYLRQTLETQAGEENAGVRLALYFQRMAKGITSYYTILADTALQEFLNVTFSIPKEMGSAKVDTQVTMMRKYFDIKDFQDPEKLKKLLARFTVMYDMKNNAAPNPVLALFNGGGQ